ncbi:unnamed protein product [Ascophyllum nodosum]
MELREFWILLSYLVLALRRALTVAWIRLNKFMSPPVRSTSEFRHKVVLIGDGFAEGLGDWVVMGGRAGAARYIECEAEADEKVRMSWQIINRGRSGSVSADWLPSDEKSLYHKKVCSKACKDAEIFVVALGTMDVVEECVGMPVAAMGKTALDDYAEDEICDTVKNIREICEALRADGKRVIVCNIMTTGAGINRLTGTAKRINRQLTLYARATATATANGLKNAAEAAPVVLVKLNNPRSTRDDGRAFDGLHLNARGYRAFGKALYEAVGPMMIAVEWKFWKSRLSGSLIEGVTSGLAGAPGSNKIVELKSVASKKAD